MTKGRTEENLYGRKVVFLEWQRTYEWPREWTFVKLLEPKEHNGARLMATGRVIDEISYKDGSRFYGVEWNLPVRGGLRTWMLREEIECTDGVKPQAPVLVAAKAIPIKKSTESRRHAKRQARRAKIHA